MVQVPEALWLWVAVLSPFFVMDQVFVPTSEVAQGGVNGYCGMFMLNMVADCFIYAVFFSLRCEMGMDGAGFWRASVRSIVMCITTFAEDRIANFL